MNEIAPPSLIALDPARLPQAAAVLADAFAADPLMVYYLPDPARRARVSPGMMLASLRYCHRYGEIWTTPDLEGVACWLPPRETNLRLAGLIRAGFGVVSLAMGWHALWRMLRSESQVDHMHAANLPEPHWYLMLLGVAPACAGRGIGGRLLAHKLEQVRAANLPAYLETNLGSNVDFYRKRGFRVLDEDELAPGGPHVWAMAAGLCRVSGDQEA